MRDQISSILTIQLVVIVLLVALIGCTASRTAGLLGDPRGLYDYGMSQYKDGKYRESLDAFQKLILGYPGLSYVDSAQYYLASSSFGDGEYHLAIAEFRRIVNSFPASQLHDDAQLMICKSYLRAAPDNVGLDQSDTESAIRELKGFLEDYPVSDLRPEAERLLVEATEKLVQKQFEAGRQYFRMGNRTSARIYLENLVTESPRSRFAAEALFLLARLDEKEEKLTDARDKLNNLMSAFPNSEYASKAARLKETIERKLADEKSKTDAEGAQVVEGKSE